MNQSEMYICSSRRLMIVMMMLMAKTTQRITTMISIGHSSSWYSFDVLKPSSRVMAAAMMVALKNQSWNLASPLLHKEVRQRRWTM